MAAREPDQDILRFVRKILTSVVLVVASPFLALAFLFFLLERPLVWSLVPLAIALILYAAAAIVWLVVRQRLKQLRAIVDVMDPARPPP